MTPPSEVREYDAIVIGSGFAGAVTACRLSEAGKTVLILERGRRYQADDYPVYPKPGDAADETGEGAAAIPEFSQTFWQLGQGLWDMRDLGDVVAVQAAGYGGGSLIYANVHIRAPAAVFDRHWPGVYSREALDPYYNLAAYMLEVEQFPEKLALPKARRLARAAKDLERTAVRLPLAVNFSRDQNRFGVEQSRCDLRGDCCFGCRSGAKSTLDLNYLELAERGGEAGEPASVETLAEVVAIERRDEDPGFLVRYRSRLYGGKATLERVAARNVFLCAGAVGSTELLMRSRAAGLLLPSPEEQAELGSRYFPNADTVAVAFDCDGLQECDRGPTITSAVLHDREPDDDDALARWNIEFAAGADEPVEGGLVRGRTSRAEGVLDRLLLHSGSWTEQTAAGELVLSGVRGRFETGEDLQIAGARFARATSGATKSSHWFLVEDGGLPSALEPMLGMFRSPLWARRNRFDEDQESDAEGRTPLQGYADLPFQSLSELANGMPGGMRGVRSLPTRFVTDTALGAASGGDGRHSRVDLWSLLPEQLATALRYDRRELLDRFAELAEPFVNASLGDIAARVDARYDIEDILKHLELPGLDAGDLGRWEVVRYVLQLAIEVGFGSQALLARYAASRLLVGLDPGGGELGQRLIDAFRWALDYRQSNGQAGVMLSMGRDSLPGSLSLEVPAAPEYGITIVGEKSGATGMLVSTSADGSWALGRARGSLVIAKLDARRFSKLEPLIVAAGRVRIGVLLDDEEQLEPSESGGDESARAAAGSLRLSVLRFAREAVEPAVTEVSDEALLDLASARMRAVLPDAFDRPELAVQARLLRDIGAAWRAELRTNPVPQFLGRELTVHSQGGCPMGREDGEGVTNADGEVVGCPGLFVMDAAAFPNSVGVNPSATIMAIAEYKVEQFLRRDLGSEWRAAHYAEAQDLTDARRDELDPLAGVATPTPAPDAAPIGIEFDEKMLGALLTVHGQEQLQVTIELHAVIGDLSRFLGHQRRRGAQAIALSGTTTIETAVGEESGAWRVVEGSHMLLFTDGAAAKGAELRQIRYELELERAGPGGDPLRRRLEGTKDLRDDEGFDVWEDASTLDTKIFDAGGGLLASGTLRVPAEEFFGAQIQSFEVTGTDDRARQSWALAAFARFFFGHLVGVYVPELDRVVDVAKNVLGRFHD